MDFDILNLQPVAWLLCAAIAVLAGIIKGMVGFAMPMVLISGLSSFLAPELALAGLILPTLVTNGMQALRQGRAAAWHSVKRFRRFLIAGGAVMVISAQFVRILPADVFLLVIGVPVFVFSLLQLLGRSITISKPTARGEVIVGGVAGAIGGISGVWGPPTVAYLTALGTEKSEQMRIQGVIYGLGSVVLLLAHVGSGVLTAKTAPLSVLLVLPAILGMWFGGRISDRIDQRRFRQATLFVLLIASLNLLRRAFFG
ncbi:sulfite exporter TauE/SafE family protein [Shimia sp. R10_1]|uniref:sulfite exporter TauE/SafE family protein n=1 Tax=Shimia sp. R10_1 TaxID=2821095 RepID=UPI001AD9811D|nr:sulfite exporter TauE/SafE family protein [Shimia sp. R10_1]MBO9472964.1 sulfite exporter TauE/SafE family protein [Shimia sp. R10_1]